MNINFGRTKGGFTLDTELVLERPIHEVFAFFAEAKNLESITPPSLDFKIVSPEPILIGQGARIDYNLKLHSVPFRWQSEISAWQPPFRFVDEQRRGPYRFWIHEHRFESVGSKTIARDHVFYNLIGGTVINSLFVRPNLRKIFSYRAKQLLRHFPPATLRAVTDTMETNRI